MTAACTEADAAPRLAPVALDPPRGMPRTRNSTGCTRPTPRERKLSVELNVKPERITKGPLG